MAWPWAPPSALCPAGGQAVAAIVKVSDGWLFPLALGLCFVERPACLLPLEDVRCVELPRLAGGQSSAFDLLVHMAEGPSHEFKNISRDEGSRLLAYLQQLKIKVGRPRRAGLGGCKL